MAGLSLPIHEGDANSSEVDRESVAAQVLTYGDKGRAVTHA